MKIAMFGGTFDPIHNGHVALGKHFADLLGLDRVYVIPTKTPPHKAAAQTPGEMRLEMCRLAVSDDARFAASDIELRRQTTSYSFITVSQLLEEHPDARLHLITGADMFMTFDQWYRFDDLKKLVTVCTVPRDDVSIEQLELRSAELREMGCDTFVSDWRPVDISSTLIRSRAAEGLSLEELVPAKVEEYIREHGLYR